MAAQVFDAKQGVDSNVAANTATGSLGEAEEIRDCVMPPFVVGGVIVLKLTRALYNLFQGLPACLLRESRCCIFLV